MARKMHARAISMDYYVDSSDDEAILNMEDTDEDDDLSTVRGGNNPHPIASFQQAFDESIADSAEQFRTGKPALELSSISAEERRKRLLIGEDYNDTYSAMWRETPAANFHPLKKIVAQITYGVHLLHVQMAVSNEEVVKILQRHIDQVDELIRRADEDLGMALADIEVRISHLKFALADRTTFDTMLEDKTYRDTIIRGNELIEDMIKRTENLMNDVVADIVCGHESITEMSNYMHRIGSSWPMTTTDLGLYNTMVLNTEGWLECFDSLKLEGKSLNGCLMQLSALVEEMARRADHASKKQKSPHKAIASPATQQSLKLPPFPTRQSSTSRDAKPIPATVSPPAVQTPTDSLTPTPSARLSIYTPPQAPADVMNLPVRRKTNISERRATAISEKRSSTATIASLFIGVDDELPPAVPELPKNRKSLRKSVKKAKNRKSTDANGNAKARPASVNSVKSLAKTKSKSKSNTDKDKDKSKTENTGKVEEAAKSKPEQSTERKSEEPSETKKEVPTIAEPVSATPSKNSATTSSANSKQSSPADDGKKSSPAVSPAASEQPPLSVSIPATEKHTKSSDMLAAPQPSPMSADLASDELESPHTFLPPRPPFAESPVLGYQRSTSPAPAPRSARGTPGHSPSPSLVIKRKPLPGSGSNSTVATPTLQHSPKLSAAFDHASQSPTPDEEPAKTELEPPPQLHKHQPSKSSLLSEPLQPRSTSPEVRKQEVVPEKTLSASPAPEHPSPAPSPPAEEPDTAPLEVLVPPVQPLLDEPANADLEPLTSKHLHLSKMNSISSANQVLNRLSISSDESDESSIVPLSELAHPFRSNSPDPSKQARSDSPAEGLGIGLPATSNTAALPKSNSSALHKSDEPSAARKAPVVPAPVIEEESEAESEHKRSTEPIMPPSQTKITIIRGNEDASAKKEPSKDEPAVKSPATVTARSPKSRDSTTSSRDSELSQILKSYVGLTSNSNSNSAASPKKSPKKVEVYQPKTAAKQDSPVKSQSPVKRTEAKTNAPPPKLEIDTQRSGSPLPFLHSATQSTCHSASLSVSSNVNKALPAIPKDLADANRSPPQSPSAPSFFSSFSLGLSSEGGGFDSISSTNRTNRPGSPQRPSSKSRANRGSENKPTGLRNASPLAPDSANSTGSNFSASLKDDSAQQRPQTSRSTKPSRSKLALFPSPSMLDLRTKGGDHRDFSSSRSRRGPDMDDADVGEDAESALPSLHQPPRLVARAKDGGKNVGSGGKGVGTKLKKLIGFGRKNQKAIDVS